MTDFVEPASKSRRVFSEAGLLSGAEAEAEWRECCRVVARGESPVVEQLSRLPVELINCSAPPEIDAHRATILGLAARAGMLQVVSELVRLGGDVNRGDKYGETPLQEASYQNNAQLAQFLIASGAICE